MPGSLTLTNTNPPLVGGFNFFPMNSVTELPTAKEPQSQLRGHEGLTEGLLQGQTGKFP